MKKSVTIMIVFILLVTAVGLACYSLRNSKTEETTIGNLNTNADSSPTIDLGNDFLGAIPAHWRVESMISDAANTVKTGSPADTYTFIPFTESVDPTDMYIGPVISTSSFTIDSRLTTRDVANLINDSSIADKVSEGTEECLFSAVLGITGIWYFAYISDNTDLSKCTDPGTEIAKSIHVILKANDDNRVLMVTYTARDDIEYQAYLGSFEEFIDSLKLDKTSIGLVDTGVSLKKYQNHQYGFSFSYPQTATMSSSEFLSNAGSVYVRRLGDSGFATNEEYTLAINVGSVEGKTLEEFTHLNTQQYGTATDVDDIAARRVEFREDNYLYIGTFFIGPQGNYYDFSIEIGPPTLAGEILGTHSQEYLDSVRDTYDSIIRTFEFTN